MLSARNIDLPVLCLYVPSTRTRSAEGVSRKKGSLANTSGRCWRDSTCALRAHTRDSLHMYRGPQENDTITSYSPGPTLTSFLEKSWRLVQRAVVRRPLDHDPVFFKPDVQQTSLDTDLWCSQRRRATAGRSPSRKSIEQHKSEGNGTLHTPRLQITTGETSSRSFSKQHSWPRRRLH